MIIPDPRDMELAVSKLTSGTGMQASRLRLHPSLWRALAMAKVASWQPHPISADGTAYGLPVVIDAELPDGGWRLEYDGIARMVEVEGREA